MGTEWTVPRSGVLGRQSLGELSPESFSYWKVIWWKLIPISMSLDSFTLSCSNLLFPERQNELCHQGELRVSLILEREWGVEGTLKKLKKTFAPFFWNESFGVIRPNANNLGFTWALFIDKTQMLRYGFGSWLCRTVIAWPRVDY